MKNFSSPQQDITSQTISPITILTFVTLIVPLNLQPPLQRNVKPFPIILVLRPFHFTSCKQHLSTQHLFKVLDISPHFPDIDSTFHAENRILIYTSGDFPII